MLLFPYQADSSKDPISAQHQREDGPGTSQEMLMICWGTLVRINKSVSDLSGTLSTEGCVSFCEEEQRRLHNRCVNNTANY